jgi:hypothetical protein
LSFDFDEQILMNKNETANREKNETTKHSFIFVVVVVGLLLSCQKNDWRKIE